MDEVVLNRYDAQYPTLVRMLFRHGYRCTGVLDQYTATPTQCLVIISGTVRENSVVGRYKKNLNRQRLYGDRLHIVSKPGDRLHTRNCSTKYTVYLVSRLLLIPYIPEGLF